MHIENDSLRVSILHPEEDRDHLGPRFCTGGYIYQVEDTAGNPLLSGPEYPAERPSVINGQGLPEVFQFTLYNREDEIPQKKLIIGVGRIDNADNHTAAETHFRSPVEEFCHWRMEERPETLSMETDQAYGGWSLRLRKEIRLHERTVTSKSVLQNTGGAPLPFRWFAHPFFPVPGDFRCCSFSPPFEIEANPAFQMDGRGRVCMTRAFTWGDGYFLKVLPAAGHRLSAHQFHPRFTDLLFSGDFPMYALALWANDRAFSIEPFFAGRLAQGAEARWSVEYRFW